MFSTLFSKTTLIFLFAVLLNLTFIKTQSECPIKYTPCTDHTVCSRVKCGPPGNHSEETPYSVWDECGCCEYWSKCPKDGPCGKCNIDKICKHGFPHCHGNNIVSIDSCGCCRLCYKALEADEVCKTEGFIYSLCKAGLKCIDGRCARKPSND